MNRKPIGLTVPYRKVGCVQHDCEQCQKRKQVEWESLLGAIARGWCYQENAHKTMDSELAVAIAKEVQALYQ